MKALIRFLSLSVALFLLSASAGAETLTGLEREMLRSNPAILAAKNRYLAATKLAIQERTLPDPVVSFTDFGVGHPFSTFNKNEFAYLGFGFSQELPFPGKLSLKEKLALKKAEAVRQELRVTAIRLRSELKMAYAETYYLQKAIEITEKNRDLLQELSKIAEARYRVGEGLQQDVLRSQVEITTIAGKLQILQQQSGSVRVSLNALLNRDLSTPLYADELSMTPLESSLEDLEGSLRRNSPEVQNKITMQESSELALRLSQKERYPDFAANFQWQRTGSNFSDYYMTSIEARIPLYFWRKQKPAIAQAQLEVKASRNETESTIRRLLSELRVEHLSATTTAELLKLYNEGVLPQTRISLQSALTAYQVGKIDFLTMLNNAIALLNYESEYERQLADHEKAIARIEQLTGTLMQPDGIDLLKELEHE